MDDIEAFRVVKEVLEFCRQVNAQIVPVSGVEFVVTHESATFTGRSLREVLAYLIGVANQQLLAGRNRG